MKKFLVVFGTIILFFFSVATLFKLLHWPGGAIMMLFSMVMFSCFFIPLFFIQRMITDRSGRSIASNISALLTTFLMFLGVLFKMMHWPGAAIMIVFGTLLFMFPTLILYVIYQMKDNERKFSELWKVVFLAVLASVFILFWGVSVSRNILVAFVNVEDATIKTNQNLISSNIYILNNIKSKDTADIRAIEIANQIHNETIKLNEYVESLKNELISKLELNPEARNNHWLINAKDNYDIPTRYLGEYDSQQGKELYKRLDAHNAFLKNTLSDTTIHLDSTSIIYIDIAVREEMASGYDMQWNEAMFYGQTIVGTLSILSSIQNQILNAEFRSLCVIEMRKK